MCIKTDAHDLIKKGSQVSNDDVQRFRLPEETAGKVEYFISTTDKSSHSKGEIFLSDDRGISIISDIVSLLIDRLSF